MILDARFAGGSIEVDTTEFLDQTAVHLSVPGAEFPMWPDEARALAAALVTIADAADRPRTLRRSAEVDETLRGIDL
ncbi:hypothetical protein M2317_002930 [Microbacterium sp. ZKA21]|uniref:hypothetical protein n=1 Tax=Microbacterium sp. ZKA21 TaxID=3381694 RepID=UPI003D1D45DF